MDLSSSRAPQKRRTRLIGTTVALLALAALAVLAWVLARPSDQGSAGGWRGRGQLPSTVGVATAQQQDIPVVLDALGTVTAGASATVRAQVSGVLRKIHFKEGQLVKAGQVLATVDARSFEMALLQASGQRLRNQAQLDSARVTLERFRTLLGQDSIARQEVDSQAALVRQLEGTVMTDRAAEGMARLALGHTQVKAPISGRVGLRATDVGNLVGPGDANGIAVVTQMAPIDVQFALPQDRVPQLQERLRDAKPMNALAFDRTRSVQLAAGTFGALDNQVDQQTGTVRAKARFANTDQALFPSQFVNLRLELRTIKNAVMVPVTALRNGSDGQFVYVLNAARRTVAVRPVTRGQAMQDRVEIVRGLKAGEQVITEGADRLEDGAEVSLPGQQPAKRGARNGERRTAPGAAPGAAPR